MLQLDDAGSNPAAKTVIQSMSEMEEYAEAAVDCARATVKKSLLGPGESAVYGSDAGDLHLLDNFD